MQRHRQSVTLFNGVQVTDSSPGQVRRYRSRRPGAWQAARILLYTYSSFPRLWSPDRATRTRDAENAAFQYRWTTWLSALRSLRKDRGAWAVLAGHLCTRAITHRDITDIAKAVIELTVRDAEIERNSYRRAPRDLATSWRSGTSSSAHAQEEQRFMGRVRRAATNNHAAVEKFIYEAIAYRDASVVHRIAQNAPAGCAVFSALSRL